MQLLFPNIYLVKHWDGFLMTILLKKAKQPERRQLSVPPELIEWDAQDH